MGILRWAIVLFYACTNDAKYQGGFVMPNV
jgi:hypothetical protein